MRTITWLSIVSSAALALVACADNSTSQAHQKDSDPSSINACDDGVDACNGNAQCISCLEDGGCASGPDPVWTGTACVCTDNDPANCVYTYCCAIGFEWNPTACACESKDHDPTSINECDDGVQACNGNEQCIECVRDAACAGEPDPVWNGTTCVCADKSVPSSCAYTYCCGTGYAWNVAACACLPCGSKH